MSTADEPKEPAAAPVAAALAASPAMSWEEARVDIASTLKEVRDQMKWWAKHARQAEADFHLAQRLHDAKLERWDRAEARKNKPSPHVQIEKLYKTMLELEKARSKRLAVLCCAADARSDQLNECACGSASARDLHLASKPARAC